MKLVVIAILDQLLLKSRIGEMCAIPGKQIGDSVQNRQCQVRRVSLSLRGDFQQFDDVLGEYVCLSRGVDKVSVHLFATGAFAGSLRLAAMHPLMFASLNIRFFLLQRA